MRGGGQCRVKREQMWGREWEDKGRRRWIIGLRRLD